MARISIVTDAWHPQVNGAVTTLDNTVTTLRALGHTVTLIEPSAFPSLPCPSYPEIRLSWASKRAFSRRIAESRPDHVLVAIEGPLGLAARRALTAQGIPFATVFFTRFHDYLWQRLAIPRRATLCYLEWFHRPARRVLAPTPAMQELLLQLGLAQARVWRPGIDTKRFRRARGGASALVEHLPRPLHLYVGRLAVEKNLEAFLSLDLAGSKVVVGDGPQAKALRHRFPGAVYLGYRNGQEIAEICSVCDVMVFPSRTDTFGLVMIEALACGLPVAAFPVRGPLDVLTSPAVGAMDNDLASAIDRALGCSSEACIEFARTGFDWEQSTRQLLCHLEAASVDAAACCR
jgi:glycosyltransferase involved in cell wall biosynthesis